MALRTGITTGACAAAAAQAAAMVLAGGAVPETVQLLLPAGQTVRVPVLYARRQGDSAVAAVRKDAGDDPDATNGLDIVVTVEPCGSDAPTVEFRAGPGVGVVTRPGLQVPPGEPAINPVPRAMIAAAVRARLAGSLRVTVSVPGGDAVAAKTFNPRLGIVGGLSILGTTGIVRPYCLRALHETIRCSLNVAKADGHTRPVLVPGNIGTRSARGLGLPDDGRIVEVANAWDFALDVLPGYGFEAVLLLGHPGKLVKLAFGQWDTHSSRSDNPATLLARVMVELGEAASGSPTVEGMLAALDPLQRKRVAAAVAQRVRSSVAARIGDKTEVAAVLVNMAGELLDFSGPVELWQLL